MFQGWGAGKPPVSGLGVLKLAVLALFLAPAGALADHDKCIALHDAAFLDEPDEVRQLLNSGVSVNCENPFGNTPLITALEGASEDTIGLLLEYGADVNALNEYGETPLQQARYQLSKFNGEKPERYARLFMDVIENLQRAGGLEKPQKSVAPPPVTQ